MNDKIRILYVDDEQENLIAFRSVFRRSYDIKTALSAEEAISIMSNDSFDLVISDQRMPNVTGVEFFERIFEKYPDPIRMILTGYSDFQAIVDAINKGKIYYYITKPWDVDEMKIIINKAIETANLRTKNKELEMQSALAQFEILKNQVNPHFLFNNLNTLKSLIELDHQTAIDFVGKFSKLYRNMLELKDQVLISLKEEIELIDDYIFLQKIRFKEGLEVNKSDGLNLREYSIPPYAIQMVLENCFKHNVIQSNIPLRIDMRIKDDFIIIQNNIQLRKGDVQSTGIGKKNIISRYSLLGLSPPTFDVINNDYIVKLPLIKTL